MEAANICLLPGLALLIAPPHTLWEALTIALAIGACAGFLLVGALYWLGLDKRLRLADRSSLLKALLWADRLERPLLAIIVAAAAAVLWSVLSGRVGRSTIAASLLTILGILEYINYYHRQLQHFDHTSDLKRFLRGRRWRFSHMRRHLARYRNGQFQ